MEKPNKQDLEKLFENEDFREKFYELAKQYDKKDRLKMSLDEIRDELAPKEGETYFSPSMDSYEAYFGSDANFSEDYVSDKTMSDSLQCKKTRSEAVARGKALNNFNYLIEIRNFLNNGQKAWELGGGQFPYIFFDNNGDLSVKETGLRELFQFKEKAAAKRFLELCKDRLDRYYKDFY